jgi:hypothetical protein
MLSDPDIPVKEKAATDNERKVTFLNLVPGRLYNITLWTVSGGVTSRPLERQVTTHQIFYELCLARANSEMEITENKNPYTRL